MFGLPILHHAIPTLILLGIGGILYTVVLGIWRLYVSPIAKFPGPRIAALTYWYEFYYEVVQPGQYIWKIREFHEKYGPIIRINPHEIHVYDPEFYHTLYAGGAQKRNRDPWHAASLPVDGSLLTSPDHELHRKRRAALNPLFSMQATRRLIPLVQERLETLTHRLDEFKDSGVTINLNHALAALTNDVITEYCFGASENRLEDKIFDPSYYFTAISTGKITILFKHFPIICKIIYALPTFIVMQVGDIADGLRQREEIGASIDKVRSGAVSKNEDRETIFSTLLANDNLPPSEKTNKRLIDEGITVVGAGSHTVAWTLTVLSYHLLSSPPLLLKLKTELATAKANGSLVPGQFEKLPFLTEVIKEALGLSYGVSLRLARIAPDAELRYGNWSIPKGTSVSMTAVLIHQNPDIFPSPREFKPERWLEDQDGRLDKYLVSFSGGSRSCLGINLAWAELYMCVAGLYGEFGSREVRGEGDRGVLELFETDISDVEIVGDAFFPEVKEGSKGLRVKISSK